MIVGSAGVFLVLLLLLARGWPKPAGQDASPSPAGPGSPAAEGAAALGPDSPREEIVAAARRGNISSLLKGGDTRPLLNPEQFTGERFNGLDVAEGYRLAAATPPDVLDEIFCYCYCALNHGHRSLLSCFTDMHATRCVVCLRQVRRAYELYRQGADIRRIEETIDREFAVG